MGSNAESALAPQTSDFADRGPEFTAEVPSRFVISATEVTFSQWLAAGGDDYAPERRAGCGDDCPASGISFFGYLGFANRLSEAHGLTACYQLDGCTGTPSQLECTKAMFSQSCTGYRLPTETEWEYAARAGTRSCVPSGGFDDDMSVCESKAVATDGWFCGNSTSSYQGCWPCGSFYNDGHSSAPDCCGVQPTGQKKPNAFGLYDVVGNVAEYTASPFEKYPLASVTTHPPEILPEQFVSVRGGTYRLADGLSCVAMRLRRYVTAPNGLHLDTEGARLVRNR